MQQVSTANKALPFDRKVCLLPLLTPHFGPQSAAGKGPPPRSLRLRPLNLRRLGDLGAFLTFLAVRPTLSTLCCRNSCCRPDMAAVYDPPHSLFLGQSGRSRPSLPTGFGQFSSRNGDRSRNSTSSFVTSMDDSSPGAVPMEFAFSDSSISESDMETWMSFYVDSDSTSPPSVPMSDPEFSSWGTNSNPPTTQGYDISDAQRIGFPIPHYHQASPPSNQCKTLQYSSCSVRMFTLVQPSAPSLHSMQLEPLDTRAGLSQSVRILQKYALTTCQMKIHSRPHLCLHTLP